MFEELAIFSLGFLTVLLGMPPALKELRKRGILGTDVHKLSRPLIPEMGGTVIIAGLMVSVIAGIFLNPEKTWLLMSFLGTVVISGAIGVIDDIKTLNARMKPFLTIFAGLPILVLQTYTPSIVFPIIGGTRLTKVYPLLIPIVMAVTSNAVNMMDPFNGVMSGTCSVVTLTLLASAILLGRTDAIILCASLLGVLISFYYYNKYPAKVFSGDVGSLSVGAALGAIAILGRLEVVAVVAFMPQIMNAFYGLSTMGRLYERREVARPITKLDDGRLVAKADPNAPLTLARFILARGPLHENEAASIFIILSIISGLLALFTAYFMRGIP